MRAVRLIVCIAFVAVSMAACGKQKDGEKEQETEGQALESRKLDQERFHRWAYIAKEKEVAPGEAIKLVIIPGLEEWEDTKCLIYTNQELRTSSMICPDAIREMIHE